MWGAVATRREVSLEEEAEAEGDRDEEGSQARQAIPFRWGLPRGPADAGVRFGEDAT